jgi:hypothetical protein
MCFFVNILDYLYCHVVPTQHSPNFLVFASIQDKKLGHPLILPTETLTLSPSCK